ncbi:MAG: tetratricopeptide repeat protein [Pseudomonadota bacterium]
MRKDFLGNPVTTTSDGTLQGINDFIRGFLSYQTCTPNVLPAADADPEGCLANAYAAFLMMFMEAPEAPEKAAVYARRALAAADGASLREARIAALAAAWAADDTPGALCLAADIVKDTPRDLAIVKIAQYILFNRGDAAGMLRFAEAAYDACKDVPYMHGMAAFAYEQCHLLEEAEDAARRALSMRADEPWAQHALAHVMLTQGRIDEGVRFMEDARGTWCGLNSFMYTHNWWHLALFYISRGRMDDALAVYDDHVWGVMKEYSQDQIGAVSLLARFELAGVDVGDRWSDPATYIAARGADTTEPFLVLQYLYGLARAGRLAEAATLLDAVKRRAEDAPDHDRGVWRDVASPAGEGLLAHVAGKFEIAVDCLGAALPRMADTGGSHAQRDLFEQIHLDAVVKTRRLSSAQQILENRRRFDPEGVPVNRMLSEVYGALGLEEEAARAAGRAAATERKPRSIPRLAVS